MKSSHKDKKSNEVGVELKYCEHCGGLWVRERGTGVVYCEKCQPKVADLPSPKMRSSRLMLPVHPHYGGRGLRIRNRHGRVERL